MKTLYLNEYKHILQPAYMMMLGGISLIFLLIPLALSQAASVDKLASPFRGSVVQAPAVIQPLMPERPFPLPLKGNLQNMLTVDPHFFRGMYFPLLILTFLLAMFVSLVKRGEKRDFGFSYTPGFLLALLVDESLWVLESALGHFPSSLWGWSFLWIFVGAIFGSCSGALLLEIRMREKDKLSLFILSFSTGLGMLALKASWLRQRLTIDSLQYKLFLLTVFPAVSSQLFQALLFGWSFLLFLVFLIFLATQEHFSVMK